MLYKNIIISRTDGIGDVVLSLPLAGLLKKMFPKSNIIFLGKNYTKSIIESCSNIDTFIAWDEIEKLKTNDEQVKAFKNLDADIIIHVFPYKKIAQLAKNANIPIRIGASGRYYHWITCNKIVKLSRKNSIYHETQLNLKLLIPLGAKKLFDESEIPLLYGLNKIAPLNEKFKKLIDTKKINIIIHPKSKGSAREWGVNNFINLIESLPSEKFKIFISGTKEEGGAIKKELIDRFPEVIDMTGQLSLEQLISFIAAADGVVAASTGPLHIASALGKYALGLYAPMRPIHPGRWAPIGINSTFLVKEGECNKCRKSVDCECIRGIKPSDVIGKLNEFYIKKMI
ncbi:MAG: glycosyltransferase family 9 protein [Bacteroidetes bacterium]|nr:glycosyltransferase family 9 protein [Bacteroidota bacterium]